jgi:acyl-CoA synthetase (AMP-forming)/AMP-acid ligase II
MTLQAALVDGAQAFPDRPWICCDDQAWSYAEGDRITDRLAMGLLATGVEPGDRVALLFGNCPELVFSYYACWKIGAIAVPLNIRFAPPELAYALGHCEAKILLGQDHLCASVMPLLRELPHLKAVHVAGDTLDGASRFDALYDSSGSAQFPAVNDGQVAAVLYTSGTTARPKGVIHTHAAICRQVENFLDAVGGDVFERSVISWPQYHISGFTVLVGTTQTAGVMRIVRRFDPEGVLDAIASSRGTYCGGLPTQVKMLVDHPGAAGFDLSSLKLFICGGDYVPGELRSRFEAMFGVCLCEICGMTELLYTVQPLRRGERRPGSIGRPMGDVRITLLDQNGEAVPDGEAGEIVARSPGMMLGYWNDPISTSAAIRGGWLHTGDLGRCDADGYYWFEGRTKDLIIRGGSNISPGEVEDVLVTHPAVSEAGVVGVPDPEFQQVVWAYVALRPGAEASEAELNAWAGTRIAAYKVPERIVFAEHLPKGLSGKMDRKALRERAAAECAGTRAALRRPTGAV